MGNGSVTKINKEKLFLSYSKRKQLYSVQLITHQISTEPAEIFRYAPLSWTKLNTHTRAHAKRAAPQWSRRGRAFALKLLFFSWNWDSQSLFSFLNKPRKKFQPDGDLNRQPHQQRISSPRQSFRSPLPPVQNILKTAISDHGSVYLTMHSSAGSEREEFTTS